MNQETKLKLLESLEAIHRKIKEVRARRDEVSKKYGSKDEFGDYNEYYETVRWMTGAASIYRELEEVWLINTGKAADILYGRLHPIKYTLFKYSGNYKTPDYRCIIEPLDEETIDKLTDFSFLEEALKEEEEHHLKFIKDVTDLYQIAKEIKEIEDRYK